MKHIECGCGQEIELTSDAYIPFIKCPNCSRRLPVHTEAEFIHCCSVCGRFIEAGGLDIHCSVCSKLQPMPHK